VKQNESQDLQEYAHSMSAKPATIYLGTRSHFRRKKPHSKGGQRLQQNGRCYRNLLKSQLKSSNQASTTILRRYHQHHQLSVKKVVKLADQVGKSNLAKTLSGSSTSSTNSKTPNHQKMAATSVLHMPTTTATPDLDGSKIDCPAGTLQQNTSSSSPEARTNSTANTVKPGLPSPSSTSETSDYQRSTPSPNAGNDDQLRSLGTTEIDWSQNNHPHQDQEDQLSGHGLPEVEDDAKIQQIQTNLQSPLQRRKSTSSLCSTHQNNHSNHQNNQISSNSNLVLQQLRVALKKLPEAKLVSSLKPNEAVKRRHSDCGLISSLLNSNDNESVKKAKYNQQPRRPLSASIHKGGQGKITAYLPEMKHFIALRKEKLDRVLNLATPKMASENLNSLTGLDEETMHDISSNDCAAKKEQPTIQQSINYESGIETGSNDTASVASSGSRHSVSSGISSHRGGDQDQDVFEVPRTIRFPPAAPTKCYSEVVICKWELCGNEFDSTGKLLDHLKSIHAVAENQKEETDNSSEDSNSSQYKCLWEGCKVYGKGSSSKLWLEKHVMSHGGNKPFQCIVDGCKHRFGTQTLLERHVNNHFKNKESPSGAVSTTTQSETGNGSGLKSFGPASRSSASNQSTGCGNQQVNSKVFRKLVGKRIKYRKITYSARIFDHFDIGSMAQIQLRLSEYEKKCQEWKSTGFFENPHLTKNPPAQTNSADQVVILHSKIIARKTDLQGNMKVLQSWNPPNILDDQWILAKDVVPTQSVKMSSLPLSTRVQLTNQMYNFPPPSSTPRRGRKIKPQPRSTALS